MRPSGDTASERSVPVTTPLPISAHGWPVRRFHSRTHRSLPAAATSVTFMAGMGVTATHLTLGRWPCAFLQGVGV